MRVNVEAWAHVQKYLERVKEKVREALDIAGHQDTQTLVCAHNIDITIIPAVDLLGTLSSGVSADPEEQ